MASCDTCGEPIIFAATKAGQRMPLNAESSPNGLWVIVNGEIRRATATDAPGERYTTHFATCPDAREHRRSR